MNGVKESRALTVPSRGDSVICLSFNPPSVLQPRESETGKESESEKRSALKPSLKGEDVPPA